MTFVVAGALFFQDAAWAQHDPLQLDPLPPTVPQSHVGVNLPDGPPAVAAYPITKMPAALAEAQAKHLPIAWVYGTRADFLPQPNAATSESVKSDLTFLTFGCLNRQRDEVITVGIEGRSGLNQLSANLKEQFLVPEDGPQEGDIQTPKIIFTNSTGDVIFARIPYSQLQAMGETSIANVLYGIHHNPQFTEMLGAIPDNAASTSTAASGPDFLTEATAKTSAAATYAAHLGEIFLLLFAGLCVVMALLGVRWPTLPSPLNQRDAGPILRRRDAGPNLKQHDAGPI